jgi:hypothetical protein
MKKFALLYVVILITFFSCKKDDYDIEYQEGYPSILAGNWVVFEFPGGEIGGNLYDPYDLVTALDPNNKGNLILDKLYNSNLRIRAAYNDTAKFYVEMGPQLETISDDSDIKYVTLRGQVSDEYYLIQSVYTLATYAFENIAFEQSDIKEAIIIYAGYYDQYKNLYDTTLIMGYRKTGFENVDY